jgi:oligopeptide transport system substrate-binding protein
MFRTKILYVVSILIVASMALAACQPAAAPTPIVQTQVVQGEGEEVIVVATSEPGEEEVAAPEPADTKKVLRLHWGPSDVPTLDSALAWDVMSIQLIDEMTIGLTRQNEVTAELENAMASDIQVSDDGLVYTFTIKEGVPWVRYDAINGEVVEVLDCEGNPRMVTAHDFEYGMKRTANPATAADYAYVLGLAVVGVDAYSTGETDDPSTVGVTALDDYTLQVTFIKPAVYNLNIMSMWFTHAMPEWLIDGDDCTEARGDKWIETGFYEGYGPFTLKEWVHDSELSLVKNPFWPGDEVVPSPAIDEIHWSIIDSSPALAEFEAGNLDVSAIPSGDQDRILADPTYAAMVAPTYSLGTEFYSFNTQLAPTDDVRVRQALSMSIDRQSLIDNVVKDNIAAAWFSHPGVAGAPKPESYPDLGIYFDAEAAVALFNEYLEETGQSASDVTITLMFNTTENNKRNAEAIQGMWQDTLGITVNLLNQEWAVFRDSRRAGNENVYRSSWVQDYPDANNFLYEVFGPGGAYQNVVDWPNNPDEAAIENPLYDQYVEIIEAAAVETDPAVRQEMYAQAEEILVVDEAVVAPLYWYAGRHLVSPAVLFTQSYTGYERYEKWDLDLSAQ